MSLIVGVSFVSIFIVSYHLVFWVCGAAHSLSWDYLPGVPQGEEAERHLGWKERPIGRLLARYVFHISNTSSDTPATSLSSDMLPSEEDREKQDPEIILCLEGQAGTLDPDETDPDVQLVRRLSRLSTVSRSSGATPQVTTIQDVTSASGTQEEPAVSSETCKKKRHHIQVPSIIARSFRPLATIVTPVTVAIAISLPIALITDLKALFVDTTASGGPDWKGPDGRPPLAFVIDTGQLYLSSSKLWI